MKKKYVIVIIIAVVVLIGNIYAKITIVETNDNIPINGLLFFGKNWNFGHDVYNCIDTKKRTIVYNKYLTKLDFSEYPRTIFVYKNDIYLYVILDDGACIRQINMHKKKIKILKRWNEEDKPLRIIGLYKDKIYYYKSMSNGISNLLSLDISNGSVRNALKEKHNEYLCGISDDGKLLCESDNGLIGVIDIENGKLLLTKIKSSRNISISNSGKYIAFLDDSFNFYKYDLTGRLLNTWKIKNVGSNVIWKIVWLPGDKDVAFEVTGMNMLPGLPSPYGEIHIIHLNKHSDSKYAGFPLRCKWCVIK